MRQKSDHPTALATQKKKTNLSPGLGHRLASVGPQGGTGKAKPAFSGPGLTNSEPGNIAGRACRNLWQDGDN